MTGRRDALECQILKQVRHDLIDEGRWQQGGLYTGEARGEIQFWNSQLGDWDWMETTWSNFELGSNAKAIELGLSLRDPESPREALSSMVLEHAQAEDGSEIEVRGAIFEREGFTACLVGGIYIGAGELGVESRESPELIQVMVATGRAVQAWCRQRENLNPLTDEQREASLPYTFEGLLNAENIIIGFNDDEATEASDISEVIRRADVELACIREVTNV